MEKQIKRKNGKTQPVRYFNFNFNFNLIKTKTNRL